MIESLARIKQSEKAAEERIRAAEKESLAIADQAAADARALRAQTETAAAEQTGRMMETACTQARAEAETIVQAGRDDAGRIAGQGQGRIETAANLIVAHITGEA